MKLLKYILLFSLVNSTFAQGIPTDLKKIVGFIYQKDSLGNLRESGTGFFVSVTDSTKQKGEIYFVTAKHVLKKSNKTTLLDSVYIRLNTLDSLSTYSYIALKNNGAEKNVFTHDDKTVDIAVVPVNINHEKFDLMVLPSDFLTNKHSFNELNIREGSEVFFTGMFTSFVGNKRIYPIVRFGRVALITEEKIPWDKEMTNLYLMETTSYGGNSGSPVFFYFGIEQGDGSIRLSSGPILKLAGIMKGYFGQNSPISVIETKKIPVSRENSGIAAVVPAYLLEEILFGTELTKRRGF